MTTKLVAKQCSQDSNPGHVAQTPRVEALYNPAGADFNICPDPMSWSLANVASSNDSIRAEYPVFLETLFC